MSRIGIKPIKIPDGVEITQTDNKLVITGPKGKKELKIHPIIRVQIDEPASPAGGSAKKIKVLCEPKLAQDKALYGTFRSLINNVIIGVTQGYEKRIEIRGVGYNGKVQGQELIINVGYSHSVKTTIPPGITITVPNPNLLVIQGVDKELVGQFSASVKSIKPCEPYNLKGIKYADEVIRRKAGKTFVSGAS